MSGSSYAVIVCLLSFPWTIAAMAQSGAGESRDSAVDANLLTTLSGRAWGLAPNESDGLGYLSYSSWEQTPEKHDDSKAEERCRIDVTEPPYNAVGDDATDNKAAIDAALAYVASRDGGTLYFPCGIYRYSGTFAVKAENVTLEGETLPGGWSKQAKTAVSALRVTGLDAGDTGFVFGEAPDVSDAYLRGLEVRQMRLVVDPNVDVAVRCWHLVGARFRDVYIYGNSDIDGSDNVVLQCEAGVDVTYDNVHAVGHCAADSVASVNSNDHAQYALKCSVGYGNTTMTTTRFRDCYFGYAYRSASLGPDITVHFQDCIFETTASRAIDAYAGYYTFDNCWWENVGCIAYIGGCHQAIFRSCLFNVYANDTFFIPVGDARIRADDCRFASSARTWWVFNTYGQNTWQALLVNPRWPGGAALSDSRLYQGISLNSAHKRISVINEHGDKVFGGCMTLAVGGPTDNVDITGVDVLYLATAANDVAVGGFTGGRQGQVLRVVKVSADNSATLEHAERGGSQDIYLASGDDETLTKVRGGWTLVCDGISWTGF